MSLNFERKIIDFFPINKQIMCFCLIFVAFSAFSASAQTKHQRYLDYIERYKNVALQSEREFGIPASITLAQGLLESSVGQSKMALEANNHFGIKAYHWTGEVYGVDSLSSRVGYRKYGCPEDSYLDHAQFLRGPRYSILYQFDVTDYRSWAQGLRDCGYAEDPAYPQKLVRIIEQYELYTLAEETVAANLKHDGDVPPPKRKETKEKTEVPPPPKRDHSARVANAFNHSMAEHQPSRAEVDHQVARNRPTASRRATTTNASSDND